MIRIKKRIIRDREQIFHFTGKEFVFGGGMGMISEMRMVGKDLGNGDNFRKKIKNVLFLK